MVESITDLMTNPVLSGFGGMASVYVVSLIKRIAPSKQMRFLISVAVAALAGVVVPACRGVPLEWGQIIQYATVGFATAQATYNSVKFLRKA